MSESYFHFRHPDQDSNGNPIDDFRTMQAELINANPHISEADRQWQLEALLGQKFTDKDGLAEATGLRKDQIDSLMSMGTIRLDESDGGSDFFSAETVQRVKDLREAGTLWASGLLPEEQAEIDAKSATATVNARAWAEDRGVSRERLGDSIAYHNLDVLKYEGGDAYLTEEQAGFLDRMNARGTLRSAVASSEPSAEGESDQ